MDDGFARLVRNFCTAVGMDEPAAEDDGSYEIAVGALGITLSPGDDGRSGIVLAALGQMPADRPDFALELLGANLYWRDTGGATLAYSPVANEIVLLQQFPVDGLDGRALASLLERFAEVAEHWSDRRTAPPAQAPAEPEPDQPIFMMRV